MGKYVPFRGGKQKSLQEALSEAEEDHFVDCPDAPYLLRAAAITLDVIFMTIAISTIHKLAVAAFVLSGMHTAGGEIPVLFSSFLIASDVTLYYLYNLWCLRRYGGTPAKLVFNLQVVDCYSGGKLNFFQILLREVIGKPIGIALAGFGMWLALIRKDHRALHDLLSGSAVKKVDEENR